MNKTHIGGLGKIHTPQRVEINQAETRGCTTLVKILRIKSFGVCQDVPSRVKNKSLHLACPSTQKEGLIS